MSTFHRQQGRKGEERQQHIEVAQQFHREEGTIGNIPKGSSRQVTITNAALHLLGLKNSQHKISTFTYLCPRKLGALQDANRINTAVGLHYEGEEAPLTCCILRLSDNGKERSHRQQYTEGLESHENNECYLGLKGHYRFKANAPPVLPQQA